MASNSLRVGLFVAHAGPGTGAVEGDLDEFELSAQMVAAVSAYLWDRGDRAFPVTEADKRHLSGRVREAARMNLDVAISIHFNRSEPAGHGTEVWYHRPESDQEEVFQAGKLATCLSSSVALQTGLRNRGEKPYSWPPHDGDDNRKKTVLELMTTVCPFVLLEVCFLNHPTDQAILLKEPFFPQKLALAVGHALDEWQRLREHYDGGGVV